MRDLRFQIICPAIVSACLALLAGCGGALEKTGDVGNKNLRPYETNEYQEKGLRLNGVHAPGSRTYQQGEKEYNLQDRWMLRNPMGNNWITEHGNDRLAMDRKTADRLKTLPGVSEAYVLIADDRAYVGIALKRPATARSGTADSAPISDSLYRQVAGKVREAVPAVHKVYVTSHPEYMERMRIYDAAEKSGHSVQDYVAEFNALAARIFPNVTYREITR